MGLFGGVGGLLNGGPMGKVFGGAASFFGIGGPSGIPDAPANAFDSSTPMNKMVSDLQKQYGSYQAPKDISAYTAKDMSKEALPQFEQARNLESQSLNASQQGESDAMQRRFAAMGNLNSGSYIKAAQMGDQQANEARANAMSGINLQEANTRTGLQQQENQKEFQSGESTKQFNAGQANQFKQFQAENAGKIAQLDLGYRSAQQQAADDQYQAAMNAFQAKHSGGLLGSGGFLGTGLGGG